MKLLLILSFLLCFLNAQEIPKVQTKEMQRISLIVKDINKLRRENNECKKQLSKKGNIQILSSSDDMQRLQQLINQQEKLLKMKDETIGKLKASLGKTTSSDGFPTLVMKEKYKTNKAKIKKEKIIHFKATSFMLTMDSIVYDDINGNKIDKWDRKTSFTSSTSTQHWIKVSGYFIDKKWTKAKQDMWIKKIQVSKK